MTCGGPQRGFAPAFPAERGGVGECDTFAEAKGADGSAGPMAGAQNGQIVSLSAQSVPLKQPIVSLWKKIVPLNEQVLSLWDQILSLRERGEDLVAKRDDLVPQRYGGVAKRYGRMPQRAGAVGKRDGDRAQRDDFPPERWLCQVALPGVHATRPGCSPSHV